MNTKRKIFAVMFLSSLLIAVLFGREAPQVESSLRIRARFAAAEKAKLIFVDAALFGVKKVEVAEGNPNFYLDERGVLIDKVQKRLVYAPQTLKGEYIVSEGMLIIGASEDWYSAALDSER